MLEPCAECGDYICKHTKTKPDEPEMPPADENAERIARLFCKPAWIVKERVR